MNPQQTSDSDGGDTGSESPGSSLDPMHNMEAVYGTTPPPNPRESKKNKEKMRSHKIKKANQDFRDSIERQRTAKIRDNKRHAVHVQKISDDIASFKLEGEDEDLYHSLQFGGDPQDMVPGVHKRKDSSKSFNIGRRQDRDFKHNSSSEFLTDSPASVPIMTLQTPIKVDSPNQFKSLNSEQVPGVESRTQPNVFFQQRRYVTKSVAECPTEREEFYRIFSQLINMGSEKKKDKEKNFQRQLSSEQLVWQNRLNDLIWLELQAWNRGVTLQEQDQYVCSSREKVKHILEEIMQFRVTLSKDEIDPNISNIDRDRVGSPEYGRHPSLDFDQAIESSANLFDVIEDQKEALVQVTEILNKLESVQQLYPTLKSLSKDNPIYATDDFQHRVNTLCLWLNITKDLGHKLQLMAKVLYIDQMHDVEWPWLEYESPNQVAGQRHAGHAESETCFPVVEVENEDNVQEREHIVVYQHLDSGINTLGESERTGASKSVHFAISEQQSPGSPSDDDPPFDLTPSDTSTPAKSPNMRSYPHVPSISRSSSSMSVDELSHCSHYRYFADRYANTLIFFTIHKCCNITIIYREMNLVSHNLMMLS